MAASGIALAAAIACGVAAAGCGGDSGGTAATLPDGEPDPLPAVVEADTCGPWAAYREGRTWVTQLTAFGSALITTTTVVSFDAETGAIAESFETVDQDGEPFLSGDSEYACTEAGLTVVSRAQINDLGGVRTDEFNPPLLLIPRSLAIGDQVTASTTRTRTNDMGSAETDQMFQYDVLYEQQVAPPGGLFTAFLVQTTDLNTGNLAERVWRAADVGPVMRLSYFGGNPRFATELIGLEDL